ncbi:MAG: response regulator transcription factor [Gammaproteobacteria bacterium]|nr:response regulator transcription factor [Gammaproteobacteria bacterium]
MSAECQSAGHPQRRHLDHRLQHFRIQTKPLSRCGLTHRESEVLTLLAKGLTCKELAYLLGISPHTSADHIKNIYSKLNINSRAEASLEAVRLGLVSPEY